MIKVWQGIDQGNGINISKALTVPKRTVASIIVKWKSFGTNSTSWPSDYTD